MAGEIESMPTNLRGHCHDLGRAVYHPSATRMDRAPTRLSALLSGAALGIGMPLFQAWQSTLILSDAARRLAFATALALLFFAPVMWFVVGIQHLRYGRSDPGGAQFRASRVQVGVRFLWWMAGAGIAFGLLTMWRNW